MLLTWPSKNNDFYVPWLYVLSWHWHCILDKSCKTDNICFSGDNLIWGFLDQWPMKKIGKHEHIVDVDVDQLWR